MFEHNQMKVSDPDLIAENEIKIEKSGDVILKLINEKSQSTSLESKYYEKITKLNKAVKVRDPG